jgi:hypothetical protein
MNGWNETRKKAYDVVLSENCANEKYSIFMKRERELKMRTNFFSKRIKAEKMFDNIKRS